MKKKQKSLIILWMGGGPPTIDLWDMKPDSPNGGEHKPKSTAASGVEISEHLPTVAKQFKNLSIIRSLNSQRRRPQPRHAADEHRPAAQPAARLPRRSARSCPTTRRMDVEAMKNADLPAFISVGGPRGGAGFLGMKYAPFNVQNPGTPPENVSAPPASTTPARPAAPPCSTGSRAASTTNVPMDAARAHKEVYEKALNLVVSTRKEVFNLDKEIDGKPIDTKLKEEYGNDGFGRAAPAGPQAGRGRHRRASRSPSAAGTCTTTLTPRSCDRTAAGARQGDGHAGEGPGPARQAEGHGDRVDGRLRPHAADQPERRPRPLEPRAGRSSSAAATSRAAWPTARPTRTAPASPRTKVERRSTCTRTLYRGLGIDPTPETQRQRPRQPRPPVLHRRREAEREDRSYWIKDLVS